MSKTLTIRCSELEIEQLDRLKIMFEEKTYTKAIFKALTNWSELSEENEELEERVTDAEGKYIDLVESLQSLRDATKKFGFLIAQDDLLLEQVNG